MKVNRRQLSRIRLIDATEALRAKGTAKILRNREFGEGRKEGRKEGRTMLYTTMPWETIFPSQCQETPILIMTTVHGRSCLVRRLEDGSRRIERLLSTDPADFLDDRFLPDTVLD